MRTGDLHIGLVAVPGPPSYAVQCSLVSPDWVPVLSKRGSLRIIFFPIVIVIRAALYSYMLLMVNSRGLTKVSSEVVANRARTWRDQVGH